uniref:N-alpha-acetyltransferase 20 n=2 Tax=Neognathae TaxID=8825 RepID=A0A663LYX1_ATHCN
MCINLKVALFFALYHFAVVPAVSALSKKCLRTVCRVRGLCQFNPLGAGGRGGDSLVLNPRPQYGIPFYLQYLAHWPEYFIVAEAPGGELMGYIMGKAEGSVAREEWHGHVTALSVAPEFRRLGLAAKLMELLEEISEKKGGFFVDLFVRVSNQVAVNMYKQLGYSVYRTVLEYYSASNGEPDEDAYDMRKALSRDMEKKSIIPLPHPVRPEDIE